MDESDIKCLPTDFVGTSKPSKRLAALYERKKKTEQQTIDKMNKEKEAICQKYEALVERKSDEVKKQLDDLKRCIKTEVSDAKIETNKDKTCFIEKINRIYKSIQSYINQQHDLVETFYSDLVNMEKDKSKELTNTLKLSYQQIKQISLKLPKDQDEFIEFEIEKINQSILCNNRNYLEVKCNLQTEVQTYIIDVIQELDQVKESWIESTKLGTSDLQKQFKGDMVSITEKTMEEITELKNSDTKNPKEWLQNVRQSLAQLDQKAQKIIINYKQAVVLIFNRSFDEIKIMEQVLNEIMNTNEIPFTQAETYTPSLEEIQESYEVELETIQAVWNNLINQLFKTINDTYLFLVAATSLWKRHFQRTKILQVIILKNVENVIKENNDLSEPYETKLNVLIDTLRQEPTKEKMRKIMEDIKKLIASIENLYRTQYQTEVGVAKKYKNAQELKIDLLLSEIRRFLAVYPPDPDKDPKIQRKRASQTSELINPTDGLIPNQMLYCKYEIDAISNWQFGLWECISNYVTMAKQEIVAETDNWIQSHLTRLEKRLETRLAIHVLRLEKIEVYIYDERLEEICMHQRISDEQKNAAEEQMQVLQIEQKLYQDMYNSILNDYRNDVDVIKKDMLTSEHSQDVILKKIISTGRMTKYIERADQITEEYLEKLHKFHGRVKASHIILCEKIKLFSECGNFTLIEIKDMLKKCEKIEAQVEKTITSLKKEVEVNKLALLEKIKSHNSEMQPIFKTLIEEHKFEENLLNIQKSLRRDLIAEVCTSQNKLEAVKTQFIQYKEDMLVNCGNFTYFKQFGEETKSMIDKLKHLAEYLEQEDSVKFYSDKSSFESASTDQSSNKIKLDQLTTQEVTGKLFNFEIHQEKNTFFQNVNKILRKHWSDMITDGEKFYNTHPHCTLSADRVHQNLPSLLNDLYEKFYHMQNQCETREMQDLKDYLSFAFTYLMFVQDYVEIYANEYTRKALKHFNNFCEEEIKQGLLNIKTEVKTKFLELHKKLKPLYGHPKNKNILEQLQIEFEIIYSEAKESFKDIKKPYLNKLENRFLEMTDGYSAFIDSISEILLEVRNLKSIVEDLTVRLNEKVQLLRMMINYYSSMKTKLISDSILSHCKSFLKIYDTETLPELMTSNEFSSHVLVEYIPQSLTQSEVSEVEEDSSYNMSKNSSHDIFLENLKDSQKKHYQEVEKEDLDEMLNEMQLEWYCAINRILNMYNVKYDQNSRR